MALDGCYDEEWEGNCPQPGIPPEGGTIMSYCNDIDFSLGFGEQPGNLIRDKVSNATCLQCAPVYIIDLKNQTINVNTEVTTICDINVQNVTVTNNAKLTLDAGGDVNINGNLEIQSGAELEIK
jgi:hypothetical protein